MFKTKVINRYALVLLGVALLIGVASCKQDGAAAKPADVDYYTCTMHPSVKSQDPKAKCPICSMDLVPVMKKGAMGMNTTNTVAPPAMSGEEKPNEFVVPV